MSEGSTKIISYWQYRSIFRGENSIFGVLEKEFPKVDINKYIFFCSLRNHGVSEKSQHCTTEIVYVHSKMMIVDDRFAIIGSANINDRSLRGTRDSEICVVVEDSEMVESSMGGQKFMARKFAKDLRMKCWNHFLNGEKFHISPSDPLLFFDTFVKTAHNNTRIYKHVFQKIHSTIKNENEIHFLEEYNEKLKPKDVSMLKGVKGVLVTFPKHFLEESEKNSEITVDIDKLFL
jgi:phospholipase D1/2